MSDVLTLAKQIIRQEAATLESVAVQIDHRFLQAVYRILFCKGNVIVCGIGKAGLIGQKLAATFASTGTPAHFIHPAEAIHGDLGRIGGNDIAVILSLSGETEEITQILPPIKKSGIPIIALTATELSTLGRNADIVLPLGHITEAAPLRLAPSCSTAAMLALGDALALTASERRRFKDSDFAVFHPGGALGKKLSIVDDYLRTLEKCRVAPQEETIRDVFMRRGIQGRRSGAVLLIDKQQKLTGIFTDSDLARLFERHNEHLLDEPIQKIMTANPISVKQGTRMLEAVAVMGEKRISELPVVDTAGCPVGLIDITDVVAAFPEMSSVDGDADNTLPSVKFPSQRNLIMTA
ncbi:MAG: KpsF/GutQ family sugar-phosphate isomerase [Planctomycetaceae bacterium]|nr:KpsF/GutQ family sugar-phosphate isomerase [Planctomycetaceae bacterium]